MIFPLLFRSWLEKLKILTLMEDYIEFIVKFYWSVAISLQGCFWVLLNRDKLVPTTVMDEEKLKVGKELVNVCV